MATLGEGLCKSCEAGHFHVLEDVVLLCLSAKVVNRRTLDCVCLFIEADSKAVASFPL